MRHPSLRAWLIAWPILLPMYAMWIIFAPVIWTFKGIVRILSWD